MTNCCGSKRRRGSWCVPRNARGCELRLLNKVYQKPPIASAPTGKAVAIPNAVRIDKGVIPRGQLDLSGLRVLDGGMATELERAGCDLSGPLWSAEVLGSAPEQVKAVHRSYLEAGADCLLTASYQVSAMGFREIGLSDADAASALRSAVRLAVESRAEYRQHAPRPVWVAASLGPFGAALHDGSEFHGNYPVDHDALVRFHRERIEVLADTEADFFAFETVPLLEEARAIVEALRVAPDLAGYISFQCRDEQHVAHGERIEDCARLLEGADQVIAMGANCTAPRFILPIVRRLRPVTSKRIVVYPNSGEQWEQATRSWSGTSDPGQFETLARAWREAGADWIGGCCRTGPAHVRALALAGAV